MRPQVLLARLANAVLRGAEPSAADRQVAQTLTIDYSVKPTARWGYERPAHPELLKLCESRRGAIAATLRELAELADELATIPFDAEGAAPRWVNGYCQGLDAASIYGFLAQRRPALYLEIGAGHSTRFARRAIDQHGLSTRVIAIDPAPRAALDGLVDEHLPTRLEDCDLEVFDRLVAGDILMLDGSHRCFTNSDVTVFFCEVLPRLASGVLLYVDDIFLPWDYPSQLHGEWWSEQYLLACWLLAGDRLDITLPNFWISTEPDLHGILAPLWNRFTWAAVPTNGTGFWMTVR